MATTTYALNSNETVKLWSRKLYREALKRTWFGKFIGEGTDSMVQRLDDTSKGPGDRVRVILRMLLTNAGIQGDGTLEGNEEPLATFTDDLVINQLRNAVRSAGRMSDQRIPFQVRDEAMNGLADWWADRFDTWMMNQLAGLTRQSDTRYTGNQVCLAPSANNIFYGLQADGATTEASVGSATASNVMSLVMIDQCVMRAKTLTPQIRPIMVDGAERYVMFIHPEQTLDLRRSSTSLGPGTTWATLQQAAMQGGEVSNNPLFSGALGMYGNTIIHESTRVPNGGSVTGTALTTVRRAVFCGAQSAAVAFGRGYGESKFDWVEELFDFRNQLGVAAGCIAGLKKLVFNSADFGTIVQVTSRTVGS